MMRTDLIVKKYYLYYKQHTQLDGNTLDNATLEGNVFNTVI